MHSNPIKLVYLEEVLGCFMRVILTIHLAGIVMSPQHCSGSSPICPLSVSDESSLAIIHPTDLHFVTLWPLRRSSIRVQPSPLRESTHSTKASSIACQERPAGSLLARMAEAATVRSVCFFPLRICLAANLATRSDVLSHLFMVKPLDSK